VIEAMDMDHRALARTFDDEAELYDRARPTYPAAVFDDLTALARLPTGARILEVGCGTGQATLQLAERGFRVTCVELGESLAAVARRNLAHFLGVEVVTADFETWQPTHGGFDAVVAFTAFHWIAQDVPYAKAASLLGDHGRLAVVASHHVLPSDGDEFFRDVQEEYEAVLPDDPTTKAGAPTGPYAIADLSDEIVESGLFRNVATRRYQWDVVYDADAYIRVLETYSRHRALDDDTRDRLLERIRRRIQQRPNAQVRKTYLTILNVAEPT
jgi:SAM-dependent methyltransferase